MPKMQDQTLGKISIMCSTDRLWELTVDGMGCSNTPKDEPKWISNDRKYVDPKSILSLGNPIVLTCKSNGDPVAHEATDDASERDVSAEKHLEVGFQLTQQSIQADWRLRTTQQLKL